MTNKTKTALGTENTANFADNTSGNITPAILRNTTQDFIDSMATQLDPNTFTASAGAQLFNGGFQASGAAIFTASVSFGGAVQVSVASTTSFIFSPTSLQVGGSTSGTTILVAVGAASGTLTVPAATDTLTGKATTDILTNKTIDTAGPNTLKVSGVTLSTGQYPGTTTNDNATAGNFGEYVESIVTSASPVTLATGSAKTVTSISLTVGDWDVDALSTFVLSTSTSWTQIATSLSTTTNTMDATAGRQSNYWAPATVPGNNTFVPSTIPPYRFNVASTTSIFLVALSTFTVASMAVFGIIRARRVR